MAKILSGVRPAVGKVVDPIARALLRVGVTPDAVTVAGTVGVLVASVLAANDHMLIAVLLNTKGLLFRRVYRALYILPVVIPPIIVATVAASAGRCRTSTPSHRCAR